METANRNMLTKMSLRTTRLVPINLCLRTLGENLEFGILKRADNVQYMRVRAPAPGSSFLVVCHEYAPVPALPLGVL